MNLELINANHNVENFDCGDESLNIFLKKEALKDTNSNLSKTYVLINDNKIIAFYSLIFSTVQNKKEGKDIIGKIYKHPTVPIMLLGRLAVDKQYQRNGIGKELLINAILHTIKASKIAGLTAIVVDAINKNVVNFYQKNSFELFPNKELKLFLPIKKIPIKYF